MVEIDPISSLTGRNADVAADMYRQILANADDSAQSFDKDMSAWNRIRSCSEPTVFSVWGDRGTGKSSVLAAVAEKLVSEPGGRFCVIGPIQPELFGATDTILNIALALLEQEVRDQSEQFPGQWDADQVRALYQALQEARLTATITRSSKKALAEASVTVYEFGSQLQQVASATAVMWARIGDVISCLFHSGIGVERHLVIVVDDPDLAPWQSPEPLLDIHNLGTVPSVTILTGGSRERTRSYLGNDPRSSASDSMYPSRNYQDTLAGELKVFPLWGAYYLTEPSWSERVGFIPPRQHVSFGTLLEQFTSFSPRDEHLLSKALLSHDSLLVGSPLPGRLRGLAQLWTEFDYLVRREQLDLPQTQANQTETARRLSQQLLDNVEIPQNLNQNFSVTWGAGLDPEALPHIKIETLPLCSALTAESWGSLPTATANVNIHESPVEFSLRRCLKAGLSWWSKENRPDARLDDLATTLAVQEILWDSGLFDIDDENTIMAGLRPTDTEFLQKTNIHGQDTDDFLISFPLIKTWSSMKPAIHAWNMIVDRWKQESLSLPEVLSLTLCAALHLTDSEEFDLSNAELDYHSSLTLLQNEVERLGLLNPYTPTLAEQELCNWYIAFVPAHWHASIFSATEISEFTEQWNKIRPLHCSQNGNRIYRNWGLGYRLRNLLNQCHDAGQARKFAWLGGYEQTIAELELDIPQPAFARVKMAWDRLITQKSMAQSAGVIQATLVASPDHSETDLSDDQEDVTGGLFSEQDSDATPDLATYQDDYGDRLMQTALEAIDQWRDSASVGD